jgi:glycosyltransferase involved in cell wall biosynthesis
MIKFENLDSLQKTIQTYLNKFSSATKLIVQPVENARRMIIVIPSFREPDLETALTSLCQCHPPENRVEVIVVLNSAANDLSSAQYHSQQKGSLREKFQQYGLIHFHFIEVDDLPPKNAGVGMARKIGMDEAVRRFSDAGFDGMIVCLDADCEVSENYIQELEKIAIAPQSYNSVCLNFEHDLESSNERLNLGILYYELFLRYYKEALKYCGFPYSYHTIGSSMAVKCSAYCMAGGMNQRKAGEDFYFLHKVFHYGKVIELNTATVFPSSRISNRVPFGTGRAQMNFAQNKSDEFYTYDFRIFEDLRQLMAFDFYNAEEYYFPETVMRFLKENDFENKLREIRKNTASESQFRKRFFAWLDGFGVLKFVHETRNHFYPNIPIEKALSELFAALGLPAFNNYTEALHILRNSQKKSGQH